MRTLLEVVQGVLNSAGSDEVDSITDSTEAMTVANIAKDCFTFLSAKSHPPESKVIFNLLASGDPVRPTLMTRPKSLLNIEWVKYRIIDTDKDVFEDIEYIPFADFLQRNYSLKGDNVSSFTLTVPGIGDYNINYLNDQNPCIWTSPDDNTILFDAYRADLETTLVSDKTMAYGRRDYAFSFEDGFIPYFDSQINEQWYNETKLQYHEDARQATNAPAARRVKDMQISNMKYKYDTPGSSYGSSKDGLPNYGRRPR